MGDTSGVIASDAGEIASDRPVVTSDRAVAYPELALVEEAGRLSFDGSNFLDPFCWGDGWRAG
jgi:hypothetical protein